MLKKKQLSLGHGCIRFTGLAYYKFIKLQLKLPHYGKKYRMSMHKIAYSLLMRN